MADQDPPEGTTRPTQEVSPLAPAAEGVNPVPAVATGGGVDSAVVAQAPGVLEADITDELAGSAPVFGDVLKTLGLAVASSQAALDKGVQQSVATLADTRVRLVTDVITELDDDGQPKQPTVSGERQSNLQTVEVSALNFFTPTVHEWKHLALSMDLTVGELDASQGVRFSRRQASVSTGLNVLWGFGAWFASGGIDAGYSTLNVDFKARQQVDWAQGTVRVDAELGPRRTENFPVPGRVSRGPLIFLQQGKVKDDVPGGRRSLPVSVQLRKASGEPNPTKPLVVTSPGLAVSGSTTTDADGKVSLTLEKALAGGPARHEVTVALGDLRRTFEVNF